MVINIKTALDECSTHISDILRRNNALIVLYINPQPVPTVITAYEPRLQTLQSRLQSIQRLHFGQLEKIVNDPDCLAAVHLKLIVADLLNAITGYTHLFEQFYDPYLRQRAPYAHIHNALQLLRDRLIELHKTRMSNPNRPLAEQLVLAPSNTTQSESGYRFCPSAVQVLNDRDQGLISHAPAPTTIASSGWPFLPPTGPAATGAYLSWTCPQPRCQFRQRFLVQTSLQNSIHTNSEILSHPTIPLEYRPTFLIKSHLHLPKPGPFHSPTSPFSPSATFSASAMRFGCLFCFAEGKPLEPYGSAFATDRELALHVNGKHQGGAMPAAVVLEAVKVAWGGRFPVGVKRWDVNFAGA